MGGFEQRYYHLPITGRNGKLKSTKEQTTTKRKGGQ